MPAVIGDVFGLGDVYLREVSPVTVGIDTSGNFITVSGWSDLRSHGWFGGGLSPGATISSVFRIDFSNDTSTASSRGSLSSARRSLTATGNSNYGWFGGGWFSPSTPQINYSTVDRIDFSNDSAAASPRSILTATRYTLAATGNSNYGWFGGGQLFDPVTPSNTTKSIIDRIDFSNDSATASPRGPLSFARRGLAATGNSNYGWFGGGYTGTPGPLFYSSVERVDFSTDWANALPRGVLSVVRRNVAATGNSNYGWFGGGFTPSATLSSVDRIDFSNDLATALPRGPFNSVRSEISATGNSNFGWFGGSLSVVDRVDFSNDLTSASPRGSLSPGSSGNAATSGQAKTSSIRLQKAGNFGWFGGGNPGPLSTVDRIDFSNDSSTASPRGPLSLARHNLTATGNSNYGWFGGGFSRSTVDRIDFSNDSATASPRGPLSAVRQSLAATGNSNYGWFGGYTTSRVDRIDFSNDATTAPQRGRLTSARGYLAATGNSNYGWFGGGSPATSAVDRIDFSNDSATASPRGSLSLTRNSLAATGNSNYGWFGCGFSPGPFAPVNTVDRIDFSNDSVTASPRSPLSARRGLSATGNTNYGWFSGGFPNPALSLVERINFSNDLGSISARGFLAAGRGYLAATSNTPIG